ncbi:MAG: ribosome biogenesis GTPase Der [Clostridiales bacterium]|nr:ribosome biogenesis GTPase Der [Clostridiales bacterium]
MSKPLVAIVGRPNVGKSTFFNRMAGRRISIVEDTPGVTRDRIYADTSWLDREFTIIDTGGLDMKSENVIFTQMREQAILAAETADAILFFVDAKQGLLPEDHEVADFLRRCGTPVLVVVNKVDHINYDENKYEFYELGLGEPYPISSLHGMGTGDLLDVLIEVIPEVKEDIDDDTIKIAIVGKPNAGKSSFVNAITGEARVIVSEIPGTTRDAIDTPFEHNGQKYTLIDTAGMRRKSKIDDKSIERYSVIRALTAVRRCDVAVIVVDAETGPTEQDAKIAGYIDEMGKPSVITVNKWDLIEKETNTSKEFSNDVYNILSFLQYAPIIFISALTGQRIEKVFALVNEVYKKTNFRVSTGVLNEVISNAVTAVSPPSVSGRRLNIMYATQASTAPPHFILFVNNEKWIKREYEKYLMNYLRRAFELTGTPIKITCRGRGDKKNEQ